MSDIKGIEIHDVLGLSQPLTKLVETIDHAIGKYYEPIGVKRMAKAKAVEFQTISEAINNNINLPSVYSAGDITIDTQNYDELIKRASSRLLFQEVRKQQNIEAIVDIAYSELEKEQSVTVEPVDLDWTIRFFNSVEDVSNEDMQKLWGKVLAGEIKQPRSFSLRTLEKIKNLSQYEAELFQELSNYCFYGIGGGIMLPYFRESNNKFNYSNIMRMQDCGLINDSLGIVYDKNDNDSEIFIHNKSIVVCIQPTNIEIKPTVHPLTDAGVELFKIIDKTHDDGYFLNYIKNFRSKGRRADISAHKILSIIEDGIEYSKVDELTLEDDF